MDIEDCERLWRAVNEYAQACGGDTTKDLFNDTISYRRMNAVVRVEQAVTHIVARARYALMDQVLDDLDRMDGGTSVCVAARHFREIVV
uniref:Uncharacterized protein n=1 Tax=viral metagenome TaxID=1070528 RepID=A0A6M3IJY8_9ZZZZ